MQGKQPGMIYVVVNSILEICVGNDAAPGSGGQGLTDRRYHWKHDNRRALETEQEVLETAPFFRSGASARSAYHMLS